MFNLIVMDIFVGILTLIYLVGLITISFLDNG